MANRLPIHYGWIIVFSGLLTVVGTLGLGRFSLGMLLPSMGSDLGLSYSQMGFIGTGNFIGYLLAVASCSWLIRRFGYRWTIGGGLLLTGVSMLLVGRADGFRAVLAAFFVTGFGSGLGNVPVMVLASHWFASSLRGMASGFMVSGSGLGIMLTGILVPSVNNWAGSVDGWRINWLVLGAIVVLISLCCTALIRNHPEEMGLEPLDGGQRKKELSGSSNAATVSPRSSFSIKVHLGSIYFLFGFTYVIYVTFVITTLINEYHFSEMVAGRFWFWFGLLGIFSGPLFGSLSDTIGRSRTLAIVYSLMALSHLLLALHLDVTTIYLSIGLFALCAWSVPSIVAAAVGDYLGPLKAAAGFATVTLFFGVGQITGPALAGILAEMYGNFRPAYLLAGLFALSGALMSMALPQRSS